eukprot:Hpha_TRINITY_DN14445_c0_g2::TRINITY_DN14445_c0_g2_i1::g.157559::m.157559
MPHMPTHKWTERVRRKCAPSAVPILPILLSTFFVPAVSQRMAGVVYFSKEGIHKVRIDGQLPETIVSWADSSYPACVPATGVAADVLYGVLLYSCGSDRKLYKIDLTNPKPTIQQVATTNGDNLIQGVAIETGKHQGYYAQHDGKNGWRVRTVDIQLATEGPEVMAQRAGYRDGGGLTTLGGVEWLSWDDNGVAGVSKDAGGRRVEKLTLVGDYWSNLGLMLPTDSQVGHVVGCEATQKMYVVAIFPNNQNSVLLSVDPNDRDSPTEVATGLPAFRTWGEPPMNPDAAPQPGFGMTRDCATLIFTNGNDVFVSGLDGRVTQTIATSSGSQGILGPLIVIDDLYYGGTTPAPPTPVPDTPAPPPPPPPPPLDIPADRAGWTEGLLFASDEGLSVVQPQGGRPRDILNWADHGLTGCPPLQGLGWDIALGQAFFTCSDTRAYSVDGFADKPVPRELISPGAELSGVTVNPYTHLAYYMAYDGGWKVLDVDLVSGADGAKAVAQVPSLQSGGGGIFLDAAGDVWVTSQEAGKPVVSRLGPNGPEPLASVAQFWADRGWGDEWAIGSLEELPDGDLAVTAVTTGESKVLRVPKGGGPVEVLLKVVGGWRTATMNPDGAPQPALAVTAGEGELVYSNGNEIRAMSQAGTRIVFKSVGSRGKIGPIVAAGYLYSATSEPTVQPSGPPPTVSPTSGGFVCGALKVCVAVPLGTPNAIPMTQCLMTPPCGEPTPVPSKSPIVTVAPSPGTSAPSVPAGSPSSPPQGLGTGAPSGAPTASPALPPPPAPPADAGYVCSLTKGCVAVSLGLPGALDYGHCAAACSSAPPPPPPPPPLPAPPSTGGPSQSPSSEADSQGAATGGTKKKEGFPKMAIYIGVAGLVLGLCCGYFYGAARYRKIMKQHMELGTLNKEAELAERIRVDHADDDAGLLMTRILDEDHGHKDTTSVEGVDENNMSTTYMQDHQTFHERSGSAHNMKKRSNPRLRGKSSPEAANLDALCEEALLAARQLEQGSAVDHHAPGVRRRVGSVSGGIGAVGAGRGSPVVSQMTPECEQQPSFSPIGVRTGGVSSASGDDRHRPGLDSHHARHHPPRHVRHAGRDFPTILPPQRHGHAHGPHHGHHHGHGHAHGHSDGSSSYKMLGTADGMSSTGSGRHRVDHHHHHHHAHGHVPPNPSFGSAAGHHSPAFSTPMTMEGHARRRATVHYQQNQAHAAHPHTSGLRLDHVHDHDHHHHPPARTPRSPVCSPKSDAPAGMGFDRSHDHDHDQEVTPNTEPNEESGAL